MLSSEFSLIEEFSPSFAAPSCDCACIVLLCYGYYDLFIKFSLANTVGTTDFLYFAVYAELICFEIGDLDYLTDEATY